MSALLCRNREGGVTRPDITTTAGVFRGTNGSNPASSSRESDELPIPRLLDPGHQARGIAPSDKEMTTQDV